MKNLLPLLALTFLFSCAENNSYSQRLLNADIENESWLLHGRTYDESRFSPLNDINDSNVADLGVLWAFETGTNRGHETTPIVVDGVMFITAPWSMVLRWMQGLVKKYGHLTLRLIKLGQEMLVAML